MAARAPEQPRRRRRRIYKPRNCRICLEAVDPTFDMAGGVAAGLFGAEPKPRYLSDDKELGRLISPCHCKGSQKYVHEGCLRAWRESAPGATNHWKCPTCHFTYRLERLFWARAVRNWLTTLVLTSVVFLAAIFALGFVADPIINLWLDPVGTFADGFMDAFTDVDGLDPRTFDFRPDDGEPTWTGHFVNGMLSLGLLGFFKSLLAMTPWQWFHYRVRRRDGRRNRLDNVNWLFVGLGIITFLGTTWKFVRHYISKVLDDVSERVIDVQGDEPDEDEYEYEEEEEPLEQDAAEPVIKTEEL